MLLPFDWAVLTLDEAKLLADYIKTSTATPAFSKNYEKMQNEGVLEIYNKLMAFIESSKHYKDCLHDFDPYYDELS